MDLTTWSSELLIHDLNIPANGSFDDDLQLLQGQDILQDNIPAYILAKKAASDWLAISYVPDSAKVREKVSVPLILQNTFYSTVMQMLYASSRASLLKAIGSSLFTDTIFATSKEDLTQEAYASHKRHMAAPKPQSAREQEMADVRAAEAAGVYEGSRARASHLGSGIGLHWSQEVEDAVKELGEGEGNTLVILVSAKYESVSLFHRILYKYRESIPRLRRSRSHPLLNQVRKILGQLFLPLTHVTRFSRGHMHIPRLPGAKSVSFLSYDHDLTGHSDQPNQVFIYSCPSSSPIKERMVYSSGVSSTYLAGKTRLSALSSPVHIASRKIETSDPGELNETYLKDELGLSSFSSDEQGVGSNPGTPRDGDEKKAFAKPRGPASRKR